METLIIMFSSLLSLLWSFIPKRYLTNHQVLYFPLSAIYERKKINERSSRMEIATVAVPAVNNHYNLSSKLKTVQWSYLQKTCGFAAKASGGKKHTLCSLLQCWPHPGRLHLLVYLKAAAACQRWLSLRAGFAGAVLFRWGSSVQGHCSRFLARLTQLVTSELTCEDETWGWAKAFLASSIPVWNLFSL